MSAEQKPGDPADKGLDTFQPTVSHRAGYGDDKLARLVDYLRRQPRATLASGEGALLLAEINRLGRILNALREPSEAVWKGSVEGYWSSWDSMDMWTAIIRAAVAAAEQEVGRE